MSLVGIDISSSQTGIDLSRVPYDFVFIKATQGQTYTNPDFNRAIQQALSAHKLVAAYHYAAGSSPSAERAHFNDIVLPYVDRIGLAVDFEPGENAAYGNAQWVRSFVGDTSSMFVYLPASGSYMHNGLANPLWLASYAQSPMPPTGYQTNPWGEDRYNCTVRQYSDNGRLPYYNGPIDLNKSYGDDNEFAKLFKGSIDMALSDDDLNKIWSYVINGVQARDRLQGIDMMCQHMPANVWLQDLNGVKAIDRVTGMDKYQLPALKAALAGQTAAIQALASQMPNVNADEINKAIVDAVNKSLASIKVNVSAS
jgi:hypothetical protein